MKLFYLPILCLFLVYVSGAKENKIKFGKIEKEDLSDTKLICLIV